MRLACARCPHPCYSICYCAFAPGHRESFALVGGSISPLGSSVYSCSYQAMAAHVAWLELIEWQEVSTAARAFAGLDSGSNITTCNSVDFTILR